MRFCAKKKPNETTFRFVIHGDSDTYAYIDNYKLMGSLTQPIYQNDFNSSQLFVILIVCASFFSIIAIALIIKVKFALKLSLMILLSNIDIVTDILLACQYIYGFGCNYCIYSYYEAGITLLAFSILGYLIFLFEIFYTIANMENDDVKTITAGLSLLKIMIEDVVSIIIILIIVSETNSFTMFSAIQFSVSMILTSFMCCYKCTMLNEKFLDFISQIGWIVWIFVPICLVIFGFQDCNDHCNQVYG